VFKIKKLFIVLVGIFTLGSFVHASMLDQVLYNIVGQASNAAGARLGDEIYYGSSKHAPRAKHRKKKHRSAKRVTSAVRMTDERRIQKALASLGFYRGNIDGQVNSFETRSAIKDMNIAYGISNTASLTPEVKDTLIFLGTLFIFDRHLIANNKGNRAKNKKLQVALKIHGYYHGGIDGAIGRGTRSSIGQYKLDTGMSGGNALDFEEEYQLISSAKEKNDRNLDDSINSLKTIGARHAQPVRQQVQQAYVPVQHQAYVPTQPQASGLAKQTHIPVQEAQQVQIQATQKKAVAPASVSSSMPDASSIEMYTDQN
jgi:peptidoglycan hydrolase-like protein with peptidoglycan-binding domain